MVYFMKQLPNEHCELPVAVDTGFCGSEKLPEKLFIFFATFGRHGKLVMPHPVLYTLNGIREYLSHTLCGINCGRRLSRRMPHHRMPISSSKNSDWVFHLSRGSRVCVWRERVNVLESWRDLLTLVPLQ